MRRCQTLLPATAVIAVALGAGLGAGCGSTKTKVAVVTVTAPGTQTTRTSHTTATTTTTTAPATTPAPATAPASAQGTSGGNLAAAVATVKRRGYTPTVTYSYHPAATLGVLLATRSGAGNANDQRAFFFVRGRFIGTDTSDPSAGINVVGQDDTSATLSYALYRPGDAVCCPSSHASVTYALNDGKLEPQGPIPTSTASAPLSRR